ncbi:MAG TPA: rhodanese-like domain-containing protein [Chryseolinea sp.]
MKTKILLMVLVFWGCSPSEKRENSAGAPEVVNLDAQGFKEGMAATPDAVVLDVRTPGEVVEGAIPGAVNIDYNAPDFGEKISALDKTKPYYVYCMGGGRGSKALDKMKAEGFTNVYNLEGGFKAWVKNGFETTKE